jgi:AhpD family alkylhydroperoxidase
MSQIRGDRCLHAQGTTCHEETIMSTTTYRTTEQRRSAVRVPLVEPTTVFDKTVAWYCRRHFGEVLDNALALMHNRKVLKALFVFEKKVAGWDALDSDLKTLAQLASASAIGCSWCMDFGYYSAHSAGLDTSKLEHVPAWRESDVFSARERRVLEYAEAMTATPPEVSDEMTEALRTELGNEAFVELTAIIAVENERSRMNSALGLTSQGFKDHCELRPAGA